MLSGRLVDADGAGLADRKLRVVSRPSRGALAQASVDTVAHGNSRRLPPLRCAAGTSRRIAVAFAGEARPGGRDRPPLTLRVRGGVDLRAAPRALQHRRGGALQRPGPHPRRAAPRRGKLVAIQYYESAAKRWRPVLVTRTDHSGRFRARYRFRYVSGSARIRLRAVALAEERWPYAPGASRRKPITADASGPGRIAADR